MRLQLTVVLPPRLGGDPAGPTEVEVEVEVEVPKGGTSAELATAIAAALDIPAETGEAMILVAGDVVEGSSPVGRGPLVDGAAVTIAVGNAPPPPRRPAPTRTPVVVAIAHGPDAGRTIELPPGSYTVGRGVEAALTVDDPRISRLHAVVTVTADAITVADAGSTNGTELDGVPVGPHPRPAHIGDTIHVGDSLLVLRAGGGVPAASAVRGDGTFVVNRRPRLHGPPPAESIARPLPPTPPPGTRVPWVSMLVPLPIAAVMALLFGPMMLAFAVVSPLIMASTVVSDRLSTRRRQALEHAVHHDRVVAAEARVGAACREEARLLVAGLPDPAQTLLTATTPTAQLWERRRTDTDVLTVSVGWCTTRARLRVVSDPGADPEHPLLERVPCALPLGDVGVTGICGARDLVMGVLRAALGQLVTLHSPRDLELVLLTGPGASAEHWSWLGRLPHVRTTDGHHRDGWLLELDGGDHARAGIAALAALVRDRAAEAGHSGARVATWSGARTLLVVDGSADLRGLPDLVEVLEHGPSVGIVVVAIAQDRAGLPSEASAVLDLGTAGAPTLRLPGAAPARLVVDMVGPWWTERLSRALAPLRDATPGNSGSAPPQAIGLCELLGLEDHDAMDAAVASAWSEQPRRTSTPIGRTAGGPFHIDLATDGPHVLVAGTTGAGKSELLRTLVVSLAVHNRPEHLSIVLVDYKGGAAFRDCAPLPHVAALVTDLDEHLASRALISLRAELKRRERLLAAARAADFVSYQRSSTSAQAPLPRLVIVIDEFRALAEELPQFVDGMVAIAALGRSLGIHLVLATQRPAGVVTADIKANMNLRIGLRLRDRSDSFDVIDCADATSVNPRSPGRALARVADGAVTSFQTAHAGAMVMPSQPDGIRVRRLTWGEHPPRWPASMEVGRLAPTELSVVVAAVTSAAALVGATGAASPWLPALPGRVTGWSLPSGTGPRRFAIGLVDEPALQRQTSLEVALDEPGHWGFVGGTGSGRSTALLMVAGSASAVLAPSDLHLYAVSGGSLSQVQALPHCGAHVPMDDLPRLERLVAVIASELAGRRELLVATGHPSMGSWRREDPATAPAALLLLVDDWDLLVERADDHHASQVAPRLLGLLREGAGLGLTAALAGDRALLVGRAASAVMHRVLLRMNDPTDLLLAGLPTPTLPAEQPPGRGLLQDGRQVQIALPQLLAQTPGGDSDATRARVQGGRPPRRVDALPAGVSTDQLPRSSRPDGPVWVGVGGDELAPLGLSTARDGRQWAVIGGPGCGVSSTLATIATGLSARDGRLCVVAAPSAAWEPLLRDPRILWCDDPGRVEELVALKRAVPDLAVLVDDADRLLDSPLDAALREVAAVADRDHGLVVVGAKAEALSVQYRGLAMAVARHRTGIVLGPTSSATAEVLGARLPVDRTAPPGRGHLVRAGVPLPIQVAATTVRT